MLEAQRSGFIFHLVRAKSERMWKEGRKQKSKDGGADEEDAARRIYCSLLIFRSATTSSARLFSVENMYECPAAPARIFFASEEDGCEMSSISHENPFSKIRTEGLFQAT